VPKFVAQNSEIEDATQPWTYPAKSFDYIHIRWLISPIPSWDALFAEAYRVLKPGGYLETWEPGDRIYADDGSVKPDDALGQWAALFERAGRRLDDRLICMMATYRVARRGAWDLRILEGGSVR